MDDRRAIIANDDLDGNTSDADERKSIINDKDGIIIKIPKRKFIVEPLLFMYMMSAIGSMPVIQQYIYSRFGNTTILQSNNGSNCDIDKNSSIFIETNKIQAQTTIFTQNTGLLSTVLSLFVTLFMGGYSDRFGRKVTILMPSFGTALQNIGVVLIIYFEAPINFLYITYAIQGLSGGYGLLMMGVFSYIADITKPEERGLRIAIAEGTVAFSAAVTQIGFGYWIKAASFLQPMLLITGVLVLNVLYAIFLVPETVQRGHNASKNSVCTYLSSTAKVYFIETATKRRVKLLMCSLIMIVISIPGLSGSSIRMLFQMNSPLCWDSVMLGYYTFEMCICAQVGAIGGIWILRKCFPELWILVFGQISDLASKLLNVIATTDMLMFSVPVAGMLSMVQYPMLRTVMSRLVDTHEQGAVFAGIALLEQSSSLVGNVLGSQIYDFSLAVSPGFVFFIYGCFYILAIIITLILIFVYNRMSRPPRLLVNIGEDSTGQNKFVGHSINTSINPGEYDA